MLGILCYFIIGVIVSAVMRISDGKTHTSLDETVNSKEVADRRWPLGLFVVTTILWPMFAFIYVVDKLENIKI